MVQSPVARVERHTRRPLDLAKQAFQSRRMIELFRPVTPARRHAVMTYIALLSIHAVQMGDVSPSRRHAQVR